MPRIDNNDFYKNALKKHGATAKGVNWHNEHTQITRFEVIINMIKDDIYGATLIDAGCGFGDFYNFVKGFDVNYIGYDIVEENCNIAKEKTKQKIYLKDILKDPLEMTDFYIASGSMNILSRFETFLFIERCFEHSKKGFIFNLPYGKDESKTFNYFLPQEIKHFVKKFDCKVTLKTGYLPNDFTIYLKKITPKSSQN